MATTVQSGMGIPSLRGGTQRHAASAPPRPRAEVSHQQRQAAYTAADIAGQIFGVVMYVVYSIGALAVGLVAVGVVIALLPWLFIAPIALLSAIIKLVAWMLGGVGLA